MSKFRPGQLAAIQSVLAGKDAIVTMPTGSGKSLCYQVSAYMMKKKVVVISPLIALMNDQVDKLQKQSLPCGAIHSQLSLEEKQVIFQKMRQSTWFILYISPERAAQDGFKKWLKTANVGLIAVDEAHCVSQWGHDFRKEYNELSQLREICPDIPFLALTATATKPIIEDIRRSLKLKNPIYHSHGFYRKNLHIEVVQTQTETQKQSCVLKALRNLKEGKAILYCSTRKKAAEWNELLVRNKLKSKLYHAGLTSEARERSAKGFSDGRSQIIVATNAYGMGVDIPDVRLVVHTQVPGSLEAYYQEIGRAGRDGRSAQCLLLYNKKDIGIHAFFIRTSQAAGDLLKAKWNCLQEMTDFADSSECRHVTLLRYFNDQIAFTKCGHCDACEGKAVPLALKTKLRKRRAVPKRSNYSRPSL